MTRFVLLLVTKTQTNMARRYLLFLLFAIFTFSHLPAQVVTTNQHLPKFQKHFVRERETPSSIAHDFNIRTKDFLMLNNFPEDVKLKPGQEVLIRTLKDGETAPKESAYIPKKEAAPAKETETSPETVAPEKERTTTSETPETKKEIAEKHVTESKSEPVSAPSESRHTEAKRETAAVDPAQLVGPNGAKYELTSGNFHVVQKGQTFYRIALIYHLTIDELKKINNMTTTDIKVGQELKVSK